MTGAAHALGETAAINRVPYISTYYIQPTVSTGEEAVIQYYVTDFEHKEYMRDDASERFTIDYWVNGSRQTVTNVPAGDQTLSLGILPEGKILFAFQAADRFGVKSHRLYQEFRVADPADAVIPADRILNPDLTQFNISSNDTDPVATTAGITALLQWAATNGYRKVVLPKGRYRIDENATIRMASGLTLDMGGSTFKLNPSGRAKSLMMDVVDCVDAHITNGVFEGDLNEHVFTNSAEWVNAFSLSEGSEYCSFEDVAVSNFPGYGACTANRKSYLYPKALGNAFVPGDMNSQGQTVASTDRTTSSNYVNISSFRDSYGFIQLGIYMGYQGNPAGSWVYRAHFYDAATNYLESVEGYFYRRLYLPTNAVNARFTLFSTNQPTTLELFNFRAPYNCVFRNIQLENIRCVGMVPSGFDNFLVEGCRFEHCGWAGARCAFDAEDGWDMAHDLTFRDNVFGSNPANEFLTCSGHNIVAENNVMTAYIWDRTHGYVLRNNRLKNATYWFGSGFRTGYVRVTNNVCEGQGKLQMQNAAPGREYRIKGGSYADGLSGPADGAAYFYGCSVTGGSINAKAVGCDIRNTTNWGGVFEIVDSTVSNCALKASGYRGFSRIAGSRLFNSRCSSGGGTIALENNDIVDSDCYASGDWSDGHEFLITSNTIRTSLPYLVYVGNSYKQVVLRDNTIYSSHTNFFAVHLYNPSRSNLFNQVVEFRDNIFYANGGCLVKNTWLPNPACVLRLHFFDNVCENIALYSANLSNQPNVKISYVPTAPPAVEWTAPAAGSVFPWGTPIALAAAASDADGRVAEVSFFAGTNLLASDTNAPFSGVWSNAPAGTHLMTAVARDDEWVTATSAGVSIAVLPPPNYPPVISLTSPSNDAVYQIWRNIPLSAAASDLDGSIKKVVFLQGTNVLAIDTNAPFDLLWLCPASGLLAFAASAEDDAGAVTTSETVTVTVSPRMGVETNHWLNAAGGNFEDAANWSNAVPEWLEPAVFNLPAAYTVTWNRSLTNRSVMVGRGTVRWDLNGNAYYFTPSNTFNLAAEAPLDLTIANGRFSISDTAKDHYLYLVGSAAQGGSTVRVTNATVVSSRLFLGYAANDSVALIVDGSGARWTEMMAGYCNWGVGAGTRASVLVTNGACMRLAGNVNLGCAAGASVMVRVAGEGSSFTNGGILMPYSAYTPPATSIVEAADGGWVFCTAASTIRSNGMIRLAGGQFLNTTTNLALNIQLGGVVEGAGLIRAKVRNIGGVIRPGGAAVTGVLSVTGDVYNTDAATMTSNGTIQIELAGPAEFDRLSMKNQFWASGFLSVKLIGGYRPVGGARFKILDFGSVSGTFAALDLPDGSNAWNTASLYTTGEISRRHKGTMLLLY